MKNEGDVKAAVKKLLNKHKWYWWMPGANGYGTQGVSDFLCLRNGTFLAIETKFGKNKPTASQDLFLSTVVANGGAAIVVTENDIEKLDEVLA